MPWTPDNNIVLHSGLPIPEDMEFFAEPPAAIGSVLSVYSTLKRGKDGWPAIVRLLASMGVGGIVAGAITLYAVMGNIALADRVQFLSLAAILGLVVFGTAWLATGFRHTMTMVGEAGVSRHVLKGNTQAVPRDYILQFDDATDLITSQTKHYYNGVYTGTSYDFRWKDHTGTQLYRVNGSYREKKGTAKPKDAFHFATAAEIAWSNYLLDILQEELEQHGSIEFRVNKNDAVRVGPGFFEFTFKGKTDRVETAEIKSLSINGGYFSINTHDAKFFGSKGKFRFSYGAMANARVFLLVLETLAGYSFGGN